MFTMYPEATFCPHCLENEGLIGILFPLEGSEGKSCYTCRKTVLSEEEFTMSHLTMIAIRALYLVDLKALKKAISICRGIEEE